MRIAAAFAEVIEMFERLSKTWGPCKDAANCLEHEFSPWSVALNGDRATRRDSRGGEVPPFAVLVRYDGAPVGVIGPAGGSIIANGPHGEAERSFIEAVKSVRP